MVTFAFGAYDSLFSASLIQLIPPKADPKKYREAVLKILTLKPTIAIAYWFMADGSYLTINQKRYYLFSTRYFHSNPVRVYFRAYPLEDQSILVQTLKDNFSIDARSSLLSIIYPVFIRSYSNFKRFGLVDLIRPYMHTCFD